MKVVVFTAIMVNNPLDNKPIDNPKMFKMIPGWDYVLVTNIGNTIFNHSGWIKGTILKMEPPKEEMPDRNHTHWSIYANRWCKWHPDKLFPDYDYIIYIDGFQVPDISKLKEWQILIQQFSTQNKSIIQSLHNKQNCIYKEHNIIIQCKKDTKEAMNKTTVYLKSMGFPENKSLMWNGCYIYKARSPVIQKVWNDLWEDMLIYTYRDQALLVYEIWKNNAFDEWIIHNLYNMVINVDSNHNHVYV
jgi:hypothetical protein